MSSNYLLNLKVNQLQTEVQSLSTDAGLYWNLVSPNGMRIDGSDTASNVAAPAGNDEMYAYTSVTREVSWQLSFTTTFGTNYMAVGISTDITQTYPSPSFLSIEMMNYGLIFETIGGLGSAFLVVNGQKTSELDTGVKPGTIYNITYDGTELRMFRYGDGLYSGAVVLGPCKLVVSSCAGGYVNKITWTGNTTGPPVTIPTLSQVLTAGNDGGGKSMVDVESITITTGGYVLDTEYNTPQRTISTTGSSHAKNNQFVDAGAVSFYELDMSSLFAYGSTPYNTFTGFVHVAPGKSAIEYDVTANNQKPFAILMYLTDTLNSSFSPLDILNVAWRTPVIYPSGSVQTGIVPGGSFITSFQAQVVTPSKLYFTIFVDRDPTDINFQYTVNFTTGLAIQIDCSIAPIITSAMTNV